MRRCIQITSEQCGRLRRGKWWNHLATRPWPVWASSRWQASSLYRSLKAVSQPWPLLCGWHTWRRTAPTRGNAPAAKTEDGIKGITEEFIVCLARVVKDAQQEEKCCYHCSSLNHFIRDCPLVAASRTDSHLNQKEGMVPKKGAQASQRKASTLRVPQDGAPKA